MFIVIKRKWRKEKEMRTLAKYLQNYKKESVLAPFFKFLEVVFDLLVPVVIAQIIDVGITNNDHGYIVQKFFILILMAAAGLIVSITAQFFAAKASVALPQKSVRLYITISRSFLIQSWTPLALIR